MEIKQLHEIAQILREAYTLGPIEPLRSHLDGKDSKTAYAIQNINTQFWLECGRKIIGKKIGLTSVSVQVQLGVDQPDFGILFEDMQISNRGNLEDVMLIQPKVEAELAIQLSSDITDSNISFTDFIHAIKAIAPALEVVDSRIRDWKITFADTVADNGSSSYFVIGNWISPNNMDVYSCGMVLEKNKEICSLGAGAACLGHPYKAAFWLAKKLIEINQPLRANEIVLTGALGPMVSIAPGDHIKAIIGGIGKCEFNFMGGLM